ncbi:Uncharacterised protein [Mycobacterium tuberculosis]|nr:Uncharacterised protein [Mycobacterium tuberculosis]
MQSAQPDGVGAHRRRTARHRGTRPTVRCPGGVRRDSCPSYPVRGTVYALSERPRCGKRIRTNVGFQGVESRRTQGSPGHCRSRGGGRPRSDARGGRSRPQPPGCHRAHRGVQDWWQLARRAAARSGPQSNVARRSGRRASSRGAIPMAAGYLPGVAGLPRTRLR